MRPGRAHKIGLLLAAILLAGGLTLISVTTPAPPRPTIPLETTTTFDVTG